MQQLKKCEREKPHSGEPNQHAPTQIPCNQPAIVGVEILNHCIKPPMLESRYLTTVSSLPRQVATVGVEILNHCIKPPKTGRESHTRPDSAQTRHTTSIARCSTVLETDSHCTCTCIRYVHVWSGTHYMDFYHSCSLNSARTTRSAITNTSVLTWRSGIHRMHDVDAYATPWVVPNNLHTGDPCMYPNTSTRHVGTGFCSSASQRLPKNNV